jgi:hypothetical protein
MHGRALLSGVAGTSPAMTLNIECGAVIEYDAVP